MRALVRLSARFVSITPMLLLAGCFARPQAPVVPLTPQQAAYEEQKDMCRSIALMGMGAPTRTGALGESLANAGADFANCMNRVAIAPQPQVIIQQQAAPPPPTHQTYVINGRTVNCSTVIRTTTCN